MKMKNTTEYPYGRLSNTRSYMKQKAHHIYKKFDKVTQISFLFHKSLHKTPYHEKQ